CSCAVSASAAAVVLRRLVGVSLVVAMDGILFTRCLALKRGPNPIPQKTTDVVGPRKSAQRPSGRGRGHTLLTTPSTHTRKEHWGSRERPHCGVRLESIAGEQSGGEQARVRSDGFVVARLRTRLGLRYGRV